MSESNDGLKLSDDAIGVLALVMGQHLGGIAVCFAAGGDALIKRMQRDAEDDRERRMTDLLIELSRMLSEAAGEDH